MKKGVNSGGQEDIYISESGFFPPPSFSSPVVKISTTVMQGPAKVRAAPGTLILLTRSLHGGGLWFFFPPLMWIDPPELAMRRRSVRTESPFFFSFPLESFGPLPSSTSRRSSSTDRRSDLSTSVKAIWPRRHLFSFFLSPLFSFTSPMARPGSTWSPASRDRRRRHLFLFLLLFLPLLPFSCRTGRDHRSRFSDSGQRPLLFFPLSRSSFTDGERIAAERYVDEERREVELVGAFSSFSPLSFARAS